MQGREQGIQIGEVMTSEGIATNLLQLHYPARKIIQATSISFDRLKELAIERGYTLKMEDED